MEATYSGVRIAVRPRWRTTRWRWWRGITWRARGSTRWSLLLLLLGCLLLIVLIVCHVVLVSSIRCVRILTPVILSILGAVVCRTSSSGSSWRSLTCRTHGGMRCRRLLATVPATVTSVVLSIGPALLIAARAAVASMLWRWLLLEALILLLDIGEKVFAELLRMLNFTRIWTTEKL